MESVVSDSLGKKSNGACFCKKKKKLWTLIMNSPRRNGIRNWDYPKASWRVYQQLKSREIFDFYCPTGILPSKSRFIHQERWKKQNCNESPVNSVSLDFDTLNPNKVNYVMSILPLLIYIF